MSPDTIWAFLVLPSAVVATAPLGSEPVFSPETGAVLLAGLVALGLCMALRPTPHRGDDE